MLIERQESMGEYREVFEKLQYEVRMLEARATAQQHLLENERKAHKNCQMNWNAYKEILLRTWTNLNLENKKKQEELKEALTKLSEEKAKRLQEKEHAMKQISDLVKLNQQLRQELEMTGVQELKETQKCKIPTKNSTRKPWINIQIKKGKIADRTREPWKRQCGMFKRNERRLFPLKPWTNIQIKKGKIAEDQEPLISDEDMSVENTETRELWKRLCGMLKRKAQRLFPLKTWLNIQIKKGKIAEVHEPLISDEDMSVENTETSGPSLSGTSRIKCEWNLSHYPSLERPEWHAGENHSPLIFPASLIHHTFTLQKKTENV
ncbi:uncharacterized protein LOC128604454 [Ictalurus furcatus]|uniref:uncharacterized protein LOC128604454 n=1 Tax=Ictalurus furcatus TaxID=66913 RepID=UPI0023502667|nr:uncharacterized protein LOC128604454 [Ictalurus furcatus]